MLPLITGMLLMAAPEPKLDVLLSPGQAIVLAATDIQSLTPQQRLTTRYLFDSKGGKEWVQSMTGTLNRISRNYDPCRPVPLANNRLLRVDLLSLISETKDLQAIIDTWDELRFEPMVNLLLTPELVPNIMAQPSRPQAILRVDGKFTTLPFEKLDLTADVLRFSKVPIELQIALNTTAPIVSGSYFENRVLSTIKDKGAFLFIWGGLYYEFNGIKRSKVKGVTDEDLFFSEILGVGGQGVKAQDIYDRLRSEQRVAMFRSDVTGKPRQIDFLPALNRRIGDGINGVSVTHDVADQDIQTIHHALLSLRKQVFKDKAREIIWIKSNGFNGYLLIKAEDGSIQDEVPFDIANDTMIPGANTKRLQAGVSCMRCHETIAGHSGWIPVRNDVQTLLKEGLDVFGDVSQPNKSVFDTLRELGSQYKGNPVKFFQGARNNFQSSLLEATGPWKGTPTDIVTVAAKYTINSYNDYAFESITPSKALKELGFESIPDEKAQDFLKVLLKPDKNSVVLGILPEDVRIFALTHGIPIYRKDFAMILSFAQFRAEQELLKGVK